MGRLIFRVVLVWGWVVCQAAIASTNVSGNQWGTWDLAGSPYILNGDVTVEQGMTLTIEVGVEVKPTTSTITLMLVNRCISFFLSMYG